LERRAFLSAIGSAPVTAAAAHGLVAYGLQILHGSRDHNRVPAIELTAFAAEHLPHRAVFSANPDPESEALFGVAGLVLDAEAIYEIRRYEPALPELEILARHGIVPMLKNRSTILIPFRSLTERNRAWDEVTAADDWKQSRSSVPLTYDREGAVVNFNAQPRSSVTQISLYRLTTPDLQTTG
jgi:hypothetical protein